MRVLISEDQEQLQTLMQLMMRKWGYESDAASNGLEAFFLAKNNHYDLCIMDLKMPVMDGYEATRKIRSELPFFPILALTGNPDSEKDDCMITGMDDFLRKPCDNNDLKQKIVELTVKPVKVEIKCEKMIISSDMPADKEELQELIELKKKGLAKYKLAGSETIFILNENIQENNLHDIIG
jgi:CheY-like chemotaxis protein